MPQQFTETTIMKEWRHITQENGSRKHVRIALHQYEGEHHSFFVLTQVIEYSNQPTDQPALSDTTVEHLIRDGKEVMIRTVNLWNSVIMEKNYAPDEDEDACPF